MASHYGKPPKRCDRLVCPIKAAAEASGKPMPKKKVIKGKIKKTQRPSSA